MLLVEIAPNGGLTKESSQAVEDFVDKNWETFQEMGFGPPRLDVDPSFHRAIDPLSMTAIAFLIRHPGAAEIVFGIEASSEVRVVPIQVPDDSALRQAMSNFNESNVSPQGLTDMTVHVRSTPPADNGKATFAMSFYATGQDPAKARPEQTIHFELTAPRENPSAQ